MGTTGTVVGRPLVLLTLDPAAVAALDEDLELEAAGA
jgi:hypothetical protein